MEGATPVSGFEAYQQGSEIVVGLLAVALVVGTVASWLRIPYSVALLIASLPLTFSPALAFAPSVLVIFLPALVFEASWGLNLGAMRAGWRPIAFLAIPGVLITAFSVAFGLSLTHTMPFLEALLLGAIVSATDPIAVSAVFKELSAPAELQVIVEGESLCNDGIAAALYSAILAIIGSGSGTLGMASVKSVSGSLEGVLVGLVAATIVAFGMRGTSSVQLQILATVVAAYAAYLVAQRYDASGIFAVLVAAVALRAYRGFPTSPAAVEEIDRFWGVLAFVSNSLVFLLLGLRINLARIWHEPQLELLTLALVLASRFVITYVGLPVLGIHDRDWKRIVMLSGMRGALSLALALVLPANIPFRPQIIDAVFGVVTVTLISQGLAIGPVLRRANFALART
jgi:CPA1 family monovalent cation:H+ antiporter